VIVPVIKLPPLTWVDDNRMEPKRLGGFTARVPVTDVPPPLATIEAETESVPEVEIGKVAEDAPVGTVMLGGTTTDGSDDES